jgi:hypothetical protein
MAIGNTTRDFGNIPMSCALPVGDATPQPIRGGKEYTDSQSNVSTNVAMTIEDGWKATYVASGTVVPVTGCTDLVTIIGSATRTVKLIRVLFSGTILTTAINGSVSLVKRSTADTAGTSTAPAIIPLDSLNAAATAVLAAYTANPTLGTTVGTIWQAKYLYQPAATGNPTVLTIDFNQLGQAGTLRGVVQQIALNLNAVAFASAGSVDYSFVFTEE